MNTFRHLVHGLAAIVLCAATPATATCVICANSVVMNEDLATCFLQKYADPSAAAGETVAVDLSRCERSPSIVLALPQPRPAAEEPDTKFLLSKTQLQCLKSKLEADEIDLDPEFLHRLGEDDARQPVAARVLLPVHEMLRGADLERIALDRRPAMRGRAQPDDVRAERDRPVIAVMGDVVQRRDDRQGPFPCCCRREAKRQATSR